MAVAERRQRAIDEPLDVRVRSTEPFLEVEVRNPIHRTGYLVLLPTYPALDVRLCTCTDFARRGLGTCKHVEAVLRWIADHPVDRRVGPKARPRSGLWKSIDRSVSAVPTDPAPSSLAWRTPGSWLFGNGPTTTETA